MIVNALSTALAGLVAPVVAWLLTYLVHSTLLIGAVWLVCRWRGLRSSRLREALWRGALLGGILTATLSVATGGASLLGRLELSPPAPSVALASPADLTGLGSPYRVVTPPDVSTAGPGTTFPSAGDASTWLQTSLPAVLTAPARHWPEALLVLWLGGMIVAGSLLIWRRRRLARYLGPRHELRAGPLAAMLADLCDIADAPLVRLTCSRSLAGPVALVGDELCLPERALTELTPEQQRSMLAHELAHLVRRDPAWLLVYAALNVVFFFQPLNRVAQRHLREVAEYLCDDWAVQQTGERLSLAHCLAQVASWMRPVAQPAPLSAMTGDSPLVRRVQRLLDDRRPLAVEELPWRRLALAGGLLLLLGWLAPGLVVQAVAPLDSPPNAVAAASAAPTSSDSVYSLAWNDPSKPASTQIQVTVDGTVALTPDHRDVQSVSAGGFLRIEETSAGTRRKLEVRPGTGGQLVRTYSVDGVAQAYDKAAQEWLAGVLSRTPLGTGDQFPDPARVPEQGQSPPRPRLPDQSMPVPPDASGGASFGLDRSTAQGDSHVEGDLTGEVAFTDDGTDVKSITPGGSFSIEEQVGSITRRLEVTSADGKTLARKYWVNGVEQAYDKAAQTWLAGLLPDVVRVLTDHPLPPGGPAQPLPAPDGTT